MGGTARDGGATARTGLLTLTLLLLTSSGWQALSQTSPPELIHHQGRLTSNTGVPSNGAFDFICRFYDLAAGGTLLLTDSHTVAGGNGVTVTNGLYEFMLGGGTLTAQAEANLREVFRDNLQVWLEVQVNAETLAPRTRMVASGYSLNTRFLQGFDWTTVPEGTDIWVNEAGDTVTGNLVVGDAAGTDRLSFGANGVLQVGASTPGTPAAGDLRYSGGNLFYWDGTQWTQIGTGAGGGGAANWIAFTRATVGGTQTAPTTAEMDTAVQNAGELGNTWRAATLLDVAMYYHYNLLPANLKFYVAGNTSAWSFAAPNTVGNPVVLTAEPPPPPNGNFPVAVVVAIRSGAPFAFTRNTLGGATTPPTTAQKDTLVQGDAWFGTAYRGATILDVGSIFSYVLPPNNQKFYAADTNNVWGCNSPTNGGDPLIISPDPPPPPNGNWPTAIVIAIRR